MGVFSFFLPTLPGIGIPVGGDVAHEQDAGVHVEVQGGSTKVALEQPDGDGAAGVAGDAEGETEAEQEVSGCQVLQVDHNAAGRLLLSSAEVKLHDVAVEEETYLQKNRVRMEIYNNLQHIHSRVCG